MKRVIPVIIALLLIVVVGAVGFGGKLWDKYSYSKERADLNEHFGVTGNRLAIILQDEMIEEQAVITGESVYFDIDTIHSYLNEGFYVDPVEQKLLYTTADDTVTVLFGGKGYEDKTEATGRNIQSAIWRGTSFMWRLIM